MVNKSNEAEFPSAPTIVAGVVDLDGSAGISLESFSTGWTLHFRFEIWRDEDRVLHRHNLLIRRQVTKEELHWYFDRIKPFEILTAQIVFIGSNTAELRELLDQPIIPSDPLVQHAAELQKPKTYEHAFFGTLTFDRKTDWYRVNTTWVGKAVELRLSADDEHLEVALQTALKLWDNQTSWNQRIEDYVVQEKLDLYNKNWREDYDPELSPEEFKTHIRLEAIVVYPNDEFYFYYFGGYIFADHTIEVYGNLQDGLTYVHL